MGVEDIEEEGEEIVWDRFLMWIWDRILICSRPIDLEVSGLIALPLSHIWRCPDLLCWWI